MGSRANSYHYGIAGYYAMMALEHDMIGISMTNANPLVAPTFGLYGMLGTTPSRWLSQQASNLRLWPILLPTIARGKLDVLEEKGKEAPEGLLQDKTGKQQTAGILKEGGSLLTLGGNVEHGGHKGFCMTALLIFNQRCCRVLILGPNSGSQSLGLMSNTITTSWANDRGK